MKAGGQGPEGGAAAPSGPSSDSDPGGSHPGGAGGLALSARALRDVWACRLRQVEEFGHTPEADRQRALWTPREFDPHGRRSLLRAIAKQFATAIEYAAFGPAKHEIVRRYLVKTAALCLAAIDWIDASSGGDEP